MMQTMMRKVKEFTGKARSGLIRAARQFGSEEKGGTQLVEIIVVIIIVIGVAAIFRTQITEFVTKVMEDLLNF